jgi:hypothetical protein
MDAHLRALRDNRLRCVQRNAQAWRRDLRDQKYGD